MIVGQLTSPRADRAAESSYQQLLNQTMWSLRDSGFEITTKYHDAARSGCWQAWLALLRKCLDDWISFGGGSFLLIEDDVIFSRGLRDYLRHNPPPPNAIANLYCTAECHRPDLMEWHEQPLPHRAQGSLAIIIPLAIARKLAADPPFPDRRDGTDHNLGVWCREHRVPFVTHSPSLVLHATTETSLRECRGRDELRQAFCFAESLSVYENSDISEKPDDGNPIRIFQPLGSRPVAREFDGIGELPQPYWGHRIIYDPPRRWFPPHPHTLAVYYRQAGE